MTQELRWLAVVAVVAVLGGLGRARPLAGSGALVGPAPRARFGEEGWGCAWSLDPGTRPRAVNGSPRLAGGKGAAGGVERLRAAGLSFMGGKAEWGRPALATLAQPLAAVLGTCRGADTAPHVPAAPAEKAPNSL